MEKFDAEIVYLDEDGRVMFKQEVKNTYIVWVTQRIGMAKEFIGDYHMAEVHLTRLG